MLTTAGAAYMAAEEAAGRAPNINTVKFADVVFPDPAVPPMPSAALVAMEGTLVHTDAPDGVGYDPVNPASVIRAVRLDSSIGDFKITQVGWFSNTGVLVDVYNYPPFYKKKVAVGQTGNSVLYNDKRQFSGSNETAAITVPAATWMYDVTAELNRRPRFEVRIGSAAEKTAGQATHTLADLIASPGTVLPAGTRASIRPGTHTLTANLELANADLVIEAESGAAILALAGFTLTLSGARARANLRCTRTTGGIVVSGQGSRLVLADFPIANVTASNGAVVSAGGLEGGAFQRGPRRLPEPLLHLPLLNSIVPARCHADTLVTFTRASEKRAVNRYGRIETLGIDIPAYESGGILLEGEATNILTYPNDFTNAAWGKTNTTIDPGVATGPDGVAGSASKLAEDGTTNPHLLSRDMAGDPKVDWAASWRVKAAGRGFVRVFIWDPSAASNSVRATVDLSNGTIYSASGSGNGVLKYARARKLENGYVEITLSGTPNPASAGTGAGVALYLLQTAGGADTYLGDGVSGVYVYEFNLVQMPFASSLINATTAAVTRAADALVISNPFGNSVRSDQPWAMLATVTPLGVPATLRMNALQFNGETPTERALSVMRPASEGANAGKAAAFMPSVAGGIYSLAALTPGAPTRLGWRFDGTKLSLWVAGIKQAEATPATPLSGAVPTAITVGNGFYGVISDVAGYPGLDDYQMSIA